MSKGAKDSEEGIPPSRRPPDGGKPQDDTPEAVAGYIADFSRELAQLARAHRLDMLAYLLDMAHGEAVQHAGLPNRTE